MKTCHPVRLCVIEDDPAFCNILSGNRDQVEQAATFLEIDDCVANALAQSMSGNTQLQAFNSLRSDIVNWRGPVIVVLDFCLNLEMATIDEVDARKRLQATVISPLLGADFARFIKQRTDGSVLATDLIGQKSVTPILLIVATSEGRSPEIITALNSYLAKQRKEEIPSCKIVWHGEIFPGNETIASSLSMISLSDYCKKLRLIWEQWQNPEDVLASNLSARQWNDLRENGRSFCHEIWQTKSDRLSHALWLHHLEGGGTPLPDAVYTEAIGALKKKLINEYIWVHSLNNTVWNSHAEWNDGALPRPWDAPPLRALIQFTCDSRPGDMEEALKTLQLARIGLIKKASAMGIDLTIANNVYFSAKWITQELWFNVPALCEGLWQLTDGLLEKDNAGSKIKILWDAQVLSTTKDEVRLCITYSVEKCHVGGSLGKPLKKLPKPSSEHPPRAYMYLRKAGGELLVDNNVLTCEIKGKMIFLGEDFSHAKPWICVIPTELATEEMS